MNQTPSLTPSVLDSDNCITKGEKQGEVRERFNKILKFIKQDGKEIIIADFGCGTGGLLVALNENEDNNLNNISCIQ